MLQQTFCHVQGIGLATEKKLWEAGILTWDDWQDHSPVKRINASNNLIRTVLSESRTSLVGNPSFFTDRLASSEHWRIYPHFRSQTAFIDIETTGLNYDAEITTVALYDGKQIKTYINGRNLDDLVEDIDQYQVIVSYNGKSFDIPFIEKLFRIKLNQAHIDLRYIMARLGFKGGLKGCEKQLGINRGSLDGVDGYAAVLLWHQYQNYGDEKALETLLAYNIEDTVNLEQLLVYAYNLNIKSLPFADQLFLDHPEVPVIPFRPDQVCVEKIKALTI